MAYRRTAVWVRSISIEATFGSFTDKAADTGRQTDGLARAVKGAMIMDVLAAIMDEAGEQTRRGEV